MFENSTGGPKEYSKGISIGVKEHSDSSNIGIYQWIESSVI